MDTDSGKKVDSEKVDDNIDSEKVDENVNS